MLGPSLHMKKKLEYPHGPCWAYVIGLGVNEKVHNTGDRNLCPIFS